MEQLLEWARSYGILTVIGAGVVVGLAKTAKDAYSGIKALWVTYVIPLFDETVNLVKDSREHNRENKENITLLTQTHKAIIEKHVDTKDKIDRIGQAAVETIAAARHFVAAMPDNQIRQIVINHLATAENLLKK